MAEQARIVETNSQQDGFTLADFGILSTIEEEKIALSHCDFILQYAATAFR
jgi:hypothetical protein